MIQKRELGTGSEREFGTGISQLTEIYKPVIGHTPMARSENSKHCLEPSFVGQIDVQIALA